MNALLETRPIEQLVDLPRMDDATWLSVMDVLAWLILPALITDKNLEAVVLLRMANISLQHGNCDASCYAYSQINVVLGLRFGDLLSGETLGQLALLLVEHHGMDRFKARVYTCFNCFVVPWSEHLSTSLEPSREAVELATAVGDPVFMVAAYRSLVTHLLVSGADLAKVQQEAEQFLTLAQKTGFRLAADGATSVLT
jgi:predicted ATPase